MGKGGSGVSLEKSGTPGSHLLINLSPYIVDAGLVEALKTHGVAADSYESLSNKT